MGTLTYAAYCFAQIPGYSAFGSYVGNGSTNGVFVYTGFRPKWIMFKQTTATEDWAIYDTTRNTSNPLDFELWANQSSAEYDGNGFVDFLSNGFKWTSIRGIGNNSGNTYIYIAFAENPFKLARAR
jgi:hypothetical protein